MSEFSVGFVGVGRMGGLLVGRTLASGRDVQVFDLDRVALGAMEQLGATVAPSLEALGERCEVAVVCVPSVAAFRSVMAETDALVSGRVHTVINASTVGARAVREAACAAASKRVLILDAPVSGGQERARTGDLALLVSGSDEAKQAATEILQSWGATVDLGSEPGTAQVVKLTNSLMSMTAFVAACEGVLSAVKMGVPVDDVLSAINSSTGASAATRSKLPNAVLTGAYHFGTTFEVMMKDLELAIAQGDDAGVPAWVGQATYRSLLAAQHRLPEGSDIAEFARLLEIDARQSFRPQ